MKNSLHLNLSQQLTLTPQLQQAIRLLQLSTLELSQEIGMALESNPMLELEESLASPSEVKPDHVPAEKTIEESTSPTDLPVDTAWDDLYDNNQSTIRKSKDEAPNYEQIIGTTIGLQEHLIWQMGLTRFSELDQAIATAIIDAINDDGFLESSLEDIRSGLGLDKIANPVDLDEIEAVLQRIQRFDPVGCGARNLRECLQIQLGQFDPQTPYLKQAKHIVENDFAKLGAKQYDALTRRYKISKEQLNTILKLIQTLDPRPGTRISGKQAEYIVPDVVVRKDEGKWHVELNNETLPRVRLNSQYVNLVKRADNSPDNSFMRNNLQDARWFLKSLQSRHETLLRVASKIVESQQGFLEHGAEAMKPMILNDIACALDLHESTISRITTQKYMHTPRGIFELKYFFSSHVKTTSGGECSSTAICAIIKKLIAAEPATKPLSDNKIAGIIGEQGINVARRTIAKYRESMQIPPSHERKTLV